ncbi:MAG: hypothetical protein WCE80_04215 [Acidimicrobiia bacterium]
MNHRLLLVTLWSVATIASISVVFAGVASVRSAIAAPGSFHLPAEAWSAPPDDPILVTTSSAQSTETSSTLAVTESEESPTTSTTLAAPPTSQAPPSTPTTEAPDIEESTTQPTLPTVESYEVEGGWVSLKLDGHDVFFESASPRPGWTVKVENQGPEEVVVVFEKGEQEIHFVAKYEDGRVKIKIED